jgi:hypothetical protein
MPFRDASVALAFAVSFGFAPPSALAGAPQAGRTSTITCSEETTRIDGIGQRVRLTGECPTVVVSGSGNRVVVERVGSLNVSGMDNQVRWERSLQGEAPRVVSSGIKNSVTRATPTAESNAAASTPPPEKPRKASPPPPPPPAPRATAPPTGTPAPAKEGARLAVKQSGQTLRLDCASRDVTVSGSTNTITLFGMCGQVSVSGSGNKITVERTPRIVTTGHNNEIMWQYLQGDQQPSVRNSGMNNTVRRGDL